MAVFGLVDAIFVLLSTGSLAYGLAAAAIPALLLWYTMRDDVRAIFADAEAERMTSNPQARS
jgi:hypothetical protein